MQTRKAYLCRRRMYRYGRFLAAHAERMPYAEVRPMRSFDTPIEHMPGEPTDCSESCAMIAHAAGAPTPYVTGPPYLGYTGTMLATLEHIAREDARRGDFVVFVSHDVPEGLHVVMLNQRVKRHPDPMVWSHGAPGVNEGPLSAEAAYFQHAHNAWTVFLRSVPERF